MSKIDKQLEKMRNNPKDWQIAELEFIAERFGITVRKGKGSHVTFSHPLLPEIVTVPAHKPIKPIYVKRFLLIIDALQERDI